MTLPRSWSFGAEPVSRDRCSDGSPGGSMEGTTSTWDTDSAEFTQDTSHESESHELKHKLDLKQQLVDQLYHMQQNERFAARKLVAQLCNKIEGLEVEVKEAKTLANEEIRDREGQDKLMEDLKALLEVKEAELQRCSTAEFQLAKAQEEIQVRDEKIADLQHQLQTAEEGLEHLLEELASRDKMIEILQDYLDMEEEKQETMEEALSSLSSDLRQSQLQVAEFGHSAQCSASQILDLEQRLEVAQDVIDHLMEEKRDGEEHRLRIQEDCECQVASQDALIEHLEALFLKEEAKQETMEEALSSLSSDLQQSQLQVEELGHSAQCSAFQIRDLEQQLKVAQDVIDNLMEDRMGKPPAEEELWANTVAARQARAETAAAAAAAAPEVSSPQCSTKASSSSPVEEELREADDEEAPSSESWQATVKRRWGKAETPAPSLAARIRKERLREEAESAAIDQWVDEFLAAKQSAKSVVEGPHAAAKKQVLAKLNDLKKIKPEERAKEYRKLMRDWHPDKNLENKDLATGVFQFLQEQLAPLK